MTTAKISSHKLAAEFCRELVREIGNENLDELNARQAAETNPNICHSHDYCDANQVMLDALSAIDADAAANYTASPNDPLNATINEAWKIARENEFCDSLIEHDERNMDRR